MKDDQAYIGTNMSLEIVMGAQDLTDMVRKMARRAAGMHRKSCFYPSAG